MFYRSKRPRITNVGIQAFLASLFSRPAAAVFSPPNVHLLADTTGLNENSVYADFAALECNFSGYALWIPTTAGPVNVGNGLWVCTFSANMFQAANPLTSGPQNALGYWLDNNNTDPVILWEEFDTPIPFAAPFDFLLLEVVLGLTQFTTIP